MKILRMHWPMLALVIGLVTVVSTACVVTGGGYGYDEGVGVGYYEPYGAIYGGWGPEYRVGPSRGGYRGPDHGGAGAAPHAWHSAPASHAMPSLPSRARSGGAHPH